MNILFLTIIKIDSIAERSIYADLMRQFVAEGHDVYIVCPLERRYLGNQLLREEGHCRILHVPSLNLQKTGLIEKGIGTLLLEGNFLKSIKKEFAGVRFDMVLYSTPPITFSKVISYIKKRDKAFSYLLLKDIFPQNAVDMGFLGKNNPLTMYFRWKEKLLYRLSDKIGCMSHANVEYVLRHNLFLKQHEVEENPNSIEVTELVKPTAEEKLAFRERYAIPKDALVCFYGGNLGKPQGIDFLVEVLRSNGQNSRIYFLIVGSGTEFEKVKAVADDPSVTNVKVLQHLPVPEYNAMLRHGDLGLIFLDSNFTIPNFPSRLLAYLQCAMPVLAATDENTDVGKVIVKNTCGFWVKAGRLEKFNEVLGICVADVDRLAEMGKNGYELLKEVYRVSRSAALIINAYNARFQSDPKASPTKSAN